MPDSPEGAPVEPVTDAPEGAPVEPPVDADLVAARRVARIAVVAAVVLAIAVVAALLVRRTGDDEPSPAVDAASGAAPGAVAGDIGPAPGATVAAYTTARQQALAAVADGDERVAVVSFTRYRTAAEADSVLAEAGLDRSVTVLARLVAAPGGDPAVVRGRLEDWASALQASAEADRAQDEQILPTVEAGSEFVAFYQRELVRLAAVRDGAQADGPVVFGLVVRAKGSALRAVAARPAVRLVDVSAGAGTPSDAQYAGLLPDDVTTVGTPPQRPVPAR